VSWYREGRCLAVNKMIGQAALKFGLWSWPRCSTVQTASFPRKKALNWCLDPNVHVRFSCVQRTECAFTGQMNSNWMITRPFSLVLVQLCASFWRVYKQYATSGHNDPALWGSFS